MPFGRIEASRYMRVYNQRAELNVSSMNHLTEAINQLSTPKPKKEPIPVQAEIDRQAAMDWIDKNQLGRRNLTKEQISVVRGRVYNRKKKVQGGTGANQHSKEQTGQNVQSAKSKPDTTATEIAHEFGVDERTIRRDGEFAEAIETLKPIADLDKDIKQKKKLSKTATVAAAKAMKEGDEEKAKHIKDEEDIESR